MTPSRAPLCAVCFIAIASACTPPAVTDAGIDSARDAALDTPPDIEDLDTSIDAPPPPPPPSEPGRHDIAIVDTRRVIPGPGLPSEAMPQPSNNNLDVVRHSDGRIYLAWRTGPNHFASPETVMYVVSTANEIDWRFEARFSAATDLREPRFLSLNGTLFLYVARLGNDPMRFEPQGMSFSERRADGTWSALTAFHSPGFIGWRTRIERGTPYMMAYLGGEHIYLADGIPLEVHMLTTTDGRSWHGVNSAMPIVSRGGGSESDFTIGDDGTLFSVIRNEAGDDTGWGSKVCRASASDITQWTCRYDPRKYDSPYMFWYDGEAYLIGRRNVTATGNFDLMTRTLSRTSQAVRYLLDYSSRPKRCAVWRYDQASDRIVFITDLPSRGDTCFPAVVRGDRDGDFAVYNYSSDIDGPDVGWHTGQQGNTFIYRTLLRFTARDARDR